MSNIYRDHGLSCHCRQLSILSCPTFNISTISIFINNLIALPHSPTLTIRTTLTSSHQVWTHPELGHCLQLPSSLCPVLQACQTIKPPATCQCRSSLSSSFTWDEHRQSAKGPCRSSFQGKPFCYVEIPSSCPDLAKSSRWFNLIGKPH